MPKRSRTEQPKLKKSEISRLMAMIGKKGGKVGGKKRAENMTQAERSKSASQAAKARWVKCATCDHLESKHKNGQCYGGENVGPQAKSVYACQCTGFVEPLKPKGTR